MASPPRQPREEVIPSTTTISLGSQVNASRKPPNPVLFYLNPPHHHSVHVHVPGKITPALTIQREGRPLKLTSLRPRRARMVLVAASRNRCNWHLFLIFTTSPIPLRTPLSITHCIRS